MGEFEKRITKAMNYALEDPYLKKLLKIIEEADDDYPTLHKAKKKATEWNNGVCPSVAIIYSFLSNMVMEYREKWF